MVSWQAFRLKGWRNRYQSSRVSGKILSWVGIVIGLLICIAIIYLPTMLSTRWDTLLFMRPDIAIPLVSIAALLGAIGLYKGVRSRV
jgi:hypothetical protein